MPVKKTDAGRSYKVDGKKLTWTTEDDGNQIEIPLRVKMKVIRAVGSQDMDAEGMFALLELIVPDQSELLDEMDVNDFQAMFTTWQSEYELLSGATLGESEGSST